MHLGVCPSVLRCEGKKMPADAGRVSKKNGGVFAGIRDDFPAENDTDTCRSFAAAEWSDSDRPLV